MDAEVSSLLYSGMRNAEWLLRCFFVRNYCEKFDPRGSFLDYENYYDLGGGYGGDRLARGLMNDILTYGDSHVESVLAEASRVRGCVLPRWCTEENWQVCRDLSAGLALWEVVDSFSLGRLVRLLQCCDPVEDATEHVWRNISLDMGVYEGQFLARIESLRSLRNLVSHQSRLWARPTTNTPTKKGKFRKKMNRCHRKSMLVAFYNVALLQGEEEKQYDFSRRIEAVLNSEPDYAVGVS